MSSISGTRDEIRRRVAGWHAAAERERSVRGKEPVAEPSRAFDWALELCEMCNDDLWLADAVRIREECAARSSWAKLRKVYACHRNVKMPG